CKNPKQCEEFMRETLEVIQEKYVPQGSPTKDGLDFTPRRLKQLREQDPLKDVITANPDITERVSPYNAVRVFGERRMIETPRKPARRDWVRKPGRLRVIYGDGSSMKNGWENAEAGTGIWEKNGIKAQARVNGNPPDNQRGELCGPILAMKSIPDEDTLKYLTD
ncbi:hypothetical protein IW261DRAFT_1309004, partial [Armillaria novae-zelandiae]